MHRFQKNTVNLTKLEITPNPKRSPHADNNDCYIHKQKRYTPQKHLSVFYNLFSKVSHYLLFHFVFSCILLFRPQSYASSWYL